MTTERELFYSIILKYVVNNFFIFLCFIFFMLHFLMTILAVPSFPDGKAEGLNLMLWEVVTFILFLALPLGYYSASKQEFPNLKIVEKCYGFFGLFYGIARLFFNFGLIIDNGRYYDEFTVSAYLLSMIGLSILVFSLERKKLARGAPIFTLIGVISSVFTLSGFEGLIPGFSDVPRETILVIISVASFLLLLMIANLYFNIMERFPGKTRTRTAYEFFGMVLFVFAIVLDGQAVSTMPGNPIFFALYYPGIMAICGMSLFIAAHFFPSWFFKLATIIVITVLAYFLFIHLGDFQVVS